MSFDYEMFVSRNIGFVTRAEQERLKNAAVFIPGVGGMGGSALNCLVRAGIGRFVISDIDTFEVSNLNRQIFSNLDVVGESKAEATRRQIQKINPRAEVVLYGPDWVHRLDEILSQVDLVLNGCDDTYASIALMRKARDCGRPAIDAFAAMFPSVYVVRPSDPRPEETFGYPSIGVPLESLTKELLQESYFKEIVYVLTHSSSIRYVDMEAAKELLSGRRKRFSFSTMVIGTGVLMAYEAVKILLDKPGVVSHKGAFYNPWKFKVEKPLPGFFAFFKKRFIESYLKSMVNG